MLTAEIYRPVEVNGALFRWLELAQNCTCVEQAAVLCEQQFCSSRLYRFAGDADSITVFSQYHKRPLAVVA